MMTKISKIGGDLNVCALKNPNNIVTKTLKDRGFEQVVKVATAVVCPLMPLLVPWGTTQVPH